MLGRDGTFVTEHVGTFQDGTAATQWRVLSGSGTGALSSLRGAGNFFLEHAEKYSVTLDFEFD